MKKLFRIILVVAILGGCWWTYQTLFPSARRDIKQRLEKCARLATYSRAEGNFKRAANIERLGRLFAPDVQIVLDIPGENLPPISGRAELIQAAAGSQRLARSLKVEILDPNIELNENEHWAIADVTLKAKPGDDFELIAQELKITFKKIEGDWLITRVESIKTLKP